jgi:hypothetical protein
VPPVVRIEAASQTVIVRCEASSWLEHPEHFTVTADLARRVDGGLDRVAGVE